MSTSPVPYRRRRPTANASRPFHSPCSHGRGRHHTIDPSLRQLATSEHLLHPASPTATLLLNPFISGSLHPASPHPASPTATLLPTPSLRQSEATATTRHLLHPASPRPRRCPPLLTQRRRCRRLIDSTLAALDEGLLFSFLSLRGIPRAAWRHAAASTPSLNGGSHHQQQHDNLRYLPLRPPAQPNAPGLAERFFSTKKSAAKDSPAGDPFYVVRKGDVVGIYKNLADCQAQVSNSGYSLRKETEEHHAARGLKNALYSINAADARDDLFGDLVACPFQQPDGNATYALKRPQEMETVPLKKHPKVAKLEPLPDSDLSCILEFDGACKGKLGKSGAGVIVRRPDGSVIAQLREGMDLVTLNTVEYRALLLGLRYAAKKGFKYVRAQGNSENVCDQAQGLRRPRRAHMVDFCKQVNQLKGKFRQIQTILVPRELNADAHAQVKLALKLPVGEIQEESTVAC